MSHRFVARQGLPGFAAAAGGGHSAAHDHSRRPREGVGVASMGGRGSRGHSSHDIHYRGSLGVAGVASTSGIERSAGAGGSSSQSVAHHVRSQDDGGAGIRGPGSRPVARRRSPVQSGPTAGPQPSSKRARVRGSEACLPPTPAESRTSLEISKTISAFARHPQCRPEGLCPCPDGSLSIREIWETWGRFHGVSQTSMVQCITEHAFHTAGHRRFLLRSNGFGQSWVTVVQRPQRIGQRRHQRRRGRASQTLDPGVNAVPTHASGTLDSDEDDSEGDNAHLLPAPGAMNPDVKGFEGVKTDLLQASESLDPVEKALEGDDSDLLLASGTLDSGEKISEGNMTDHLLASGTSVSGENDFEGDNTDFLLDLGTRDSGENDLHDVISQRLHNAGMRKAKSEPALESVPMPSLLDKDEEVLISSSVPLACTPVLGTPGILEGFHFHFTETDNFGRPIVPGGPSSAMSESGSSGSSDQDVPCPGPPALARCSPDEPRVNTIPPAPVIPPDHPRFSSTPRAEGHHISTPTTQAWCLKVTLAQDTRRMPLHCAGTPPFHEVISGVCTLFQLSPFDPAESPVLSYRDSDGDSCTFTHTTYHDALPLFSATRIIRLFLAATLALPGSSPSTPKPDTSSHAPDHLPPNTTRYSPPAHVLDGLSRDQSFLQESQRRDLDHATAKWRTKYSDNPCSRTALQALRDIFPNDSAGGLAVLRSCFPGRFHGPRTRSSSMSVLPPPRQCSVPGTWSAEETLSAAQWIMGNPGLSWSPTPGAGGHKQIRIRNAVINHWNSGVVNVQGRDAQLVSEKLLSTRQGTVHPPPGSDLEWTPVSRRRKRPPPSPSAQFSSPVRSSAWAHAPPSPTLHHFPSGISRFSALSPHDQVPPDPNTSCLTTPSSLAHPQPGSVGPPRRCPKTLDATTLCSGLSSVRSSSNCSPSPAGGLVAISWFLLLLMSYSEWFLCGLRFTFELVRSLIKPFCSLARKSRRVGHSRCRGYSSQLARRRGAGGRSQCLESCRQGLPTRPLWKRSSLWAYRLAYVAPLFLLSTALCLTFPGCHAVFSTPWPGPGGLPGCSATVPCTSTGPAFSRCCCFDSPQHRSCLFENVPEGSVGMLVLDDGRARPFLFILVPSRLHPVGCTGASRDHELVRD